MNLPIEFQNEWRMRLNKIQGLGWRLVDIEKTLPGSAKELKVIVKLRDVNGYPLDRDVMFSFDTGAYHPITEDFIWSPPLQQGDIFATNGGRIEHVQGSVVKKGQPGGITVFIWDPKFQSEVLTGAGALADHTGLELTFQLEDGSESIFDRLNMLEARVTNLELNESIIK